MKIVKQCKLFFKEGNSDKVYEIDMCDVGNETYLVNFRYGKRDAVLKDGTKTTAPVSLAEANGIFNALEMEKRKKGYQNEEEMLAPLPEIQVETSPAGKANTLAGAVILRLQNAIEKKEQKFKWKTSRVIWRAGELRIKEAVPFIIKLLDRGDEMQRYAALWALARMADPQATRTFGVYFQNEKYTEKTRRIAGEGLLQVLPADSQERKEHIGGYLNRLPDACKAAVIAQNTTDLQSIIQDRVVGQKQADILSVLYSLSLDYTFITPVLSEAVKQLPLRPPFFKAVRQVLKLAEVRDDYSMLGIIALKFERENAMYNAPSSSGSVYDDEDDSGSSAPRAVHILELGITLKPKSELKKKDSRIAYSDRTRDYFRRRTISNLKEMGESESENYVKLAVQLLQNFDKKNDYTAPYSSTDWVWNSKERDYFTTEWRYIAYSKWCLYNWILYGNSSRLDWTGKVWRYKLSEGSNNRNKTRTVNPYPFKEWDKRLEWKDNQWTVIDFTPKPTPPQEKTGLLDKLKDKWLPKLGLTKPEEQTASTNSSEIEREEPFSTLWDKKPEAYLTLLAKAKTDEIHAFALVGLKRHPKYKELINRLDAKYLRILLSSAGLIPMRYAVELITEKGLTEQDPELIVALALAQDDEISNLGISLMNKNPLLYLDSPDSVIRFLTHSSDKVASWTMENIQLLNWSQETRQVFVGKSVAWILQQPAANAQTRRVADVLKTHFVQLMQKVSIQTVSDLSKATNENAHQLAATAVQKWTDEDWKNQSTLMRDWLFSPSSDMRETVEPIVARIAHADKQWGVDLANLLVPYLMRKEVFEGSHETLEKLLSTGLVHCLGDIDKTTTLRLLYANYRSAQNFALVLLEKYNSTDSFTTRQWIAMGDHELLAARTYCQKAYLENIPRVKYEREEAIRLLDAKWDDTRAFAVQFFKTQFTKEDWTPEILISIADSVRTDIQALGRELITKFFEDEDGEIYLEKLAQHPSMEMQLFATAYLTRFAKGSENKIASLEHYFRVILTRPNKGRTAKDRVLTFLEQEALAEETIAQVVIPIIGDVAATSAVQDKSKCILILHRLQKKYPHINTVVKSVNL